MIFFIISALWAEDIAKGLRKVFFYRVTFLDQIFLDNHNYIIITGHQLLAIFKVFPHWSIQHFFESSHFLNLLAFPNIFILQKDFL